MLELTIPAIDIEMYDDEQEEFVTINIKEQTLQLEHSLVSLSKWESKWCKPFLSKEAKTLEETIDYVRCMTLTKNVDPNVYRFLTDEHVKQINSYIEAPMTATTFSNRGPNSPNREIITAELVYYWMVALNIPFECQKWHLNRLLTLVRVCNVKNSPSKKMSRRDTIAHNKALNDARRARMNSRG